MKTEKLTLKHLAAYLPYRLIIRCGKTKSFDRELTHDYFNDNKVCVTAVLNVGAYKPILRPLSDLKEFDKSEVIIFTPCYRWILVNDIDEIKTSSFNWLIKNHFDVFGLIDAGLAIDINKLEDETNG